jgi:hypothetical protein
VIVFVSVIVIVRVRVRDCACAYLPAESPRASDRPRIPAENERVEDDVAIDEREGWITEIHFNLAAAVAEPARAGAVDRSRVP